jgi:Fe2+ or Zn2+ uptake regulation protein
MQHTPDGILEGTRQSGGHYRVRKGLREVRDQEMTVSLALVYVVLSLWMHLSCTSYTVMIKEIIKEILNITFEVVFKM